MDQFQRNEREKTIRNAVTSARQYLDRYPGRTVSLMLSNALTVSGIIELDATADTVFATCANDGRGFTSGGKTVKVSVHDITAVSEDNADLVTNGTLIERSKGLFKFIMSQYDEGISAPVFTSANHEFDGQVQEVTEPLTEEQKELVAATRRKNVAMEVSRVIYSAARRNRDFAEMRREALLRIGLPLPVEFNGPVPVSERVFREAMIG